MAESINRQWMDLPWLQHRSSSRLQHFREISHSCLIIELQSDLANSYNEHKTHEPPQPPVRFAMVLGRQGPLAKALTSGIGLTQEYRADRQARRERDESERQPATARAAAASRTPSPNDTESEEDDEAWAQDLDSAEEELTSASPPFNSNETIDDVVRAFLSSNPLPTDANNTEPLPQPVILPQRRPGMRTRGWVRGYAPVLARHGVSPAAWLDFLAGFKKAIGQNRWFHVMNLAVWVADKIRVALQGIPLIARVVSVAIHFSLEMTVEGISTPNRIDTWIGSTTSILSHGACTLSSSSTNLRRSGLLPRPRPRPPWLTRLSSLSRP